jgi:hypothetical protein
VPEMDERGPSNAEMRRLEKQLELANERSEELFDRVLALQVGMSRVLLALLVRDHVIESAEWNHWVEDLALKQDLEALCASPDQATRLNRVGAALRELSLADAIGRSKATVSNRMLRSEKGRLA